MERFETWSQLMLLFFQGLVNVDARTSRIANKPDDLDVVVHCTGTESKLHACRTIVLFYVFHVCVVCMPESCSSLWDCHFSCCNHIKPAFNILRAVQAAADREREPFEAWGCAPEGGLAAAPVVQSGPSVVMTASQLQRDDFFSGGSMTAKMLRLANGVVSIRSAQGCGPPRHIACGFTSHARLRNVLLTCMKRPHESKPSCNLWIARRGKVSDL